MRDASRTILVLGGGPAGCTAASLLARWGHHVIVRTKPPAEGPQLVESIPPSTRKLFDTIGLRAAIDAVGFLRSTGNTVLWGAEPPRVECFAEGERGWQVTRDGLETALRAHLTSAGVRVEHARVDATIVDTMRPAYTLDCTGRSGVIARARGLRVTDTASHTVALTAVWQAVRPFDVPDPTHTLIETYDGGWAWSAPAALDRRVVAVMVDPATSGLARGVGAREVYTRELDKTCEMANLVERALLINGPSGWDASMYNASRYVDGDVLLVGDAASFVDPVSSAGIKKALASGWLAAVAVHTSLRRPAMRDVALAFYGTREAEVYAALRASTSRVFAAAAAGHAHPFWSDRTEPENVQSTTGEADASAAAAFERLRTEASLHVEQSPDARIEDRPAISGTEIVLEPRLVRDDVPQGIRYAFDVDMIGLLTVAPKHSSVPDALEAYNRRYAPVAAPDFLAALSTALARKWLVWV